MCVCALLSLSPLTNIPGFDHWFLPWWPHLILSPLKGPASKYYMRIKCQHLEPTLTPCQNLGRLYINQGSPKDRAFVCISVPMYTRGKKRTVLKSLDHTVLKTGKCKLCWVDQSESSGKVDVVQVPQPSATKIPPGSKAGSLFCESLQMIRFSPSPHGHVMKPVFLSPL